MVKATGIRADREANSPSGKGMVSRMGKALLELLANGSITARAAGKILGVSEQVVSGEFELLHSHGLVRWEYFTPKEKERGGRMPIFSLPS